MRVERPFKESLLVFDSMKEIESDKQERLFARHGEPFKGTRLYVPQVIAWNFHVCDLIIGDDSQFPRGTNGVPAIACAGQAAFNEWGMPVEMAGVDGRDIELVVHNIAGKPVRFVGMLFGLVRS